MDKHFCKLIDDQLLVEQYVAGKLKGEILEKFEEHIKECDTHLQAVMLEKALQRGITEFARSEIRTKLKKRIEKREDTKYLILRYAAILFIAVITPLLLYYQFAVRESGFDEMTPYTDDYPAEKSTDSVQIVSPVPPTPPEKSELKMAIDESDQLLSATSVGKTGSVTTSGTTAGERPDAVPAETATDDEAINQPAKMTVSHEEKILSGLAAQSESLQTMGMTAARKMSAKAPAASSLRRIDISSTEHELDHRFKADKEKFHQCMEKHLFGQELAAYQAQLSINIDNGGSVRDVKFIDASTRSEKLENCIKLLIENWMFEPDSGQRFIKGTVYYEKK